MHGHGGIVLERLKALAFHQDLRPGDVFTWYTTTGWMMWNYLAGGLLAGLTIVLYDGSATYPDTGRLWRLAAEHGVTYLGVGAPYLVACMKAGLRPGTRPTCPRCGPSARPDRRCRLRHSAGCTTRSRRTCCSAPSPAAPTCAPASWGPARCCRSGPASSPAAAWARTCRPTTRPASRSSGGRGELVITPADAVHAGRVLGRSPAASGAGPAPTSSVYPGVWRHGDWVERAARTAPAVGHPPAPNATLNRGGVRLGTS